MSQDLITSMESFGIIVDRPVRFDGKPVRYRMSGKQSRSAFMIGHEVSGKLYARFGTWQDRTQDQKWTNNGAGTPHCDHQWRELATAAKLLQEEEQKKTAKKSSDIWEGSNPCEAHQYIESKSVKSHGLRVDGETLLVPIMDETGELVNLQRIYPDGEKKFLYGGRVTGCCYPIKGSDKQIFICEGYATGATIHELTGCRVLVAFNAGNLKAVARSARDQWPGGNIVIAADNDHATEGNPGVKYANAAADEIGARVVVPECPPGTDFNDMAAGGNIPATTALLMGVRQRIKSTSIRRIMSTEYPPIKWAVEGIIPEGLTVLAGRPKLGKSWLMLGMAYAIANGLPAWNYGKTTKSSVYYLALEDSERRIKDRVQSMEGYFDTYPDNLHILTEFPKINEGFIEEIERIVKVDSNVGCIIVDTLQKIRPNSGAGKKNLYQSEYEDFGLLQKTSIRKGVPVLAVHHTRKAGTRAIVNPMDEMSGSSGLQGVADTLIVCTRDGNNGKMYVTGREVDENEYPMEFNRVNMTWTLADPEDKQIDVGPMVLSDFFKSNNFITAKQAAEVFGVNQRTAKRRLNAMAEGGKLILSKPSNPKDPDEYHPSDIFQ